MSDQQGPLTRGEIELITLKLNQLTEVHEQIREQRKVVKKALKATPPEFIRALFMLARMMDRYISESPPMEETVTLLMRAKMTSSTNNSTDNAEKDRFSKRIVHF